MYRITANAASTPDREAPPAPHRASSTTSTSPSRPPRRPARAGGGVGDRRSAELGRAVDALPPKLRSVVVLKDVYGLPHEAIADELGISVAAAKVRLHRGRKRLREMLDDESGRSARAV